MNDYWKLNYIIILNNIGYTPSNCHLSKLKTFFSKQRKSKEQDSVIMWTPKQEIKHKRGVHFSWFVINVDISWGAVEEISAVIESQATAATHVQLRGVLFAFIFDAK